ncbi:MAG: RNA-directed DNA polymerase [Clostridia bacterium]|nr:RNA-directed DNA polymerase [Clostridia bacterium]
MQGVEYGCAVCEKAVCVEIVAAMPRRLQSIWPVFCSVDNCIDAIYLGTEKKRTDPVVIKLFEYSPQAIEADPKLKGKIDPAKAKDFAEKLVARLQAGKWKPHKPRHIRRWCKACNKKGGKWREIDCASIEDHIVHWMLILACKRAFTRGMYAHTCGSVEGRGTKHIRKYCERWAKHDRKSTYFVKLDIEHFFPSIDHELLFNALQRVIKDKRILAIFHAIIESCASDPEGRKGIAVGYYTSPWFANLLLQPLDYFITQQLFKTRRGKRINFVRHFARYMDDMILFGSSKRDLEKAVRAIAEELQSKYGLKIKMAWEIKAVAEFIVTEDGKRKLKPGTAFIDLCGYKYSRDVTVLRDGIFLSTARTAKKIYRRKRNFGEVRLHDAQSINSKIGWAKHAQSRNFTDKYITPYVNMNEMKEVISNAAKCGICKQT